MGNRPGKIQRRIGRNDRERYRQYNQVVIVSAMKYGRA